MIAWTIEAALASNVFDRVLVSTDSEEIALIAKEYGADVPFLREQCTDDHSTVSDVMIHVLHQIRTQLDESYSTITQLMPNCPLRTTSIIVDSFRHFQEHNYDSQISCFQFGWNNPWWAVTLDAENKPKKLFPDAFKSRSQDLSDLYCPTGAIWISKVDKLIQSGTFYSSDHRFFPISWCNSVDIDTPDDWAMAELIFQRNNKCQEQYEQTENSCFAW